MKIYLCGIIILIFIVLSTNFLSEEINKIKTKQNIILVKIEEKHQAIFDRINELHPYHKTRQQIKMKMHNITK